MKLAAVLVIVSVKLVFADSYQDSISVKQDENSKVTEKVEFVLAINKTYLAFAPLKKLSNLAFYESFNTNLPTAIYVHGWRDDGKRDSSCSAMRDAYLDLGGYNVISIDWSSYSKNFYYHLTVIPQLKVIAEAIAEQLLQLDGNGYSISNIHLVGHSLGAQIIGKVGRQLKVLSNGTLVVPQIYALDPAGPGFEHHWIDDFEPLTKSDAAYVQVIHTDSGRLGMQTRVGHIDFYPNGGSRHPGCKIESFSPEREFNSIRCNHARAWHFYQQSVRYPKAFPAIRCDSWDDFLGNKTCYRDEIDYMGFGGNLQSTGKFFLQTRANMFNLTKDMEGLVYTPPKVERLMTPLSYEKGSMNIPAQVQENDYF